MNTTINDIVNKVSYIIKPKQEIRLTRTFAWAEYLVWSKRQPYWEATNKLKEIVSGNHDGSVTVTVYVNKGCEGYYKLVNFWKFK